jgi:phenylacetate-CoA ligase
VNVFPTQIEELILQQPALAPHYQCILTREGPLDCLTVAVEAAAAHAHDSSEARAAAERLAHQIKVYVGTSAKIEVRPAGGIERSMGKARRVLDQRKP